MTTLTQSRLGDTGSLEHIGFRPTDLRVGPNHIEMNFGPYHTEIYREEDGTLSGFCTCPGGRRGHLEPREFQPGQQGVCKHLNRLWGLSSILWGYSHGKPPSDRVARSFEQALAMACSTPAGEKMVLHACALVRERCAAQYLTKGQKMFTMDIISDFRLDKPTQRWKTAIPYRLTKEGFWWPVGDKNSKVDGNNAYRIRSYILTPRTIKALSSNREDRHPLADGVVYTNANDTRLSESEGTDVSTVEKEKEK